MWNVKFTLKVLPACVIVNHMATLSLPQKTVWLYITISVYKIKYLKKDIKSAPERIKKGKWKSNQRWHCNHYHNVLLFIKLVTSE